jgi:hypothetical protein
MVTEKCPLKRTIAGKVALDSLLEEKEQREITHFRGI